MDRKFYFIVVATEAPEKRAMYVVDIRDGIMMLSEKMAKGKAPGEQLVSEMPLEKVSIRGEKVFFIGTREAIECTLSAACTTFADAQRCYATDDLRPADSRWLMTTAEVLSVFKKLDGGTCLYQPAELRA